MATQEGTGATWRAGHWRGRAKIGRTGCLSRGMFGIRLVGNGRNGTARLGIDRPGSNGLAGWEWVGLYGAEADC
jgi:hypothetical protein